MSIPNELTEIVELILEEDLEQAEYHLLIESTEERIIQALSGERMPMDYMLKFEQFLDEHDIYLFDGWDTAQFITKPRIEKYWAFFYLKTSKDTDLRGALRIQNSKEGQNKVGVKKTGDGYIFEFKILKRYLDQLDQKNKEEASRVASDEFEQIGQS
jgi:hypothetical protein